MIKSDDPALALADAHLAAQWRELFGNISAAEIQRRLERAQLLQKQAEVQCERLRQRKADSDPLAIAVFMEQLKWGLAANLRNPLKAARYALMTTKEILNFIEENGGLRSKNEAGG